MFYICISTKNFCSHFLIQGVACRFASPHVPCQGCTKAISILVYCYPYVFSVFLTVNYDLIGIRLLSTVQKVMTEPSVNCKFTDS